MSNSESRRKAAAARLDRIRIKSTEFSLKEGNEIRFVADVMLGRLAKWLRIVGYDVLYSNKFADDDLIAISNREERILLSRDTRLLIRKAVRNFIFLQSGDTRDQIKQVIQEVRQTDFPFLLTRCLSCNEALADVPRESVCGRAPPFIFKTQSRFKTCPKCGKLYWAGTHRDAVVRTLAGLCRPCP